ncbi:glucose dehydrogenase [FAD, quinone]-like [Parasteatoda tepidariorum]|uniref:glucose dehydrogenase [FAD, quinone]-like n=1 Tax=Parasteatoda tepidariorum TaxID=114398 RepID=UPI001C727847|nr:glucose dehydrogenase [FAD, quinone]-like [Parasteatoda tepidariorum]
MNSFWLLSLICFSTGLTNAGVLDDITSTASGLLAIPALIPSLKKQKHSPNTASDVKKSYDYVIIGAGSAGSVLANRLSANPCVSVVVLEAGSTPPILTEIPSAERFFVHSSIDWDFESVPQQRSGQNLKERKVRYASGKVLGGSSVLNDVQYSRGNPQNYDDWESMGAKGWAYKDVYKYFLKLEDNRDPEYANDGYHSVGGPQTVSKPNYNPELKKHIFEAAKSLNIPVTDSNSPHQLGIYDLQGTLRDGQLCSTAKGYLVPADSRSNLDIVKDAFVRKIIIKNGVATDVEFKYKGSIRTVAAEREVILSAGTVNTPKILMLSGIGPAEHLKEHKIDVNADLPGVGQNLQDHVGSIENFEVNNTVNVLFKMLNPANIGKYVYDRSGVYSAAQLVLALSYLQNQNNPRVNSVPDHQLYFVELNTVLPLLDFNLKPEVFSQVYSKYTFTPYLGCLVHLMHPGSRGTITLKSADPEDPPLIDPNYFEDPSDVHDIVEALKDCRRFADTRPMKEIGTKRFDTLYPGCEEYAGNEDEYYRCQVITVPITYYHYAGTAKMGDPRDNMSVVDPELRVKGIKNLRVVDSSVMPTITTGNTNIPTIMIAEKASDMILSSVNCKN